MLTEHYYRVREFMQKAGQATPESPCQPPPDELCRVIKLDLEELLEKARAAGVTITLTQGLDTQLEHESNEFSFAVTGPFDIVEYADACGDLSVTNTCAMIAAGIPDVPLLEEVDRSNLSKFGPGGYRDESGKWIKAPGWSRPDILGVLAKAEQNREVL